MKKIMYLMALCNVLLLNAMHNQNERIHLSDHTQNSFGRDYGTNNATNKEEIICIDESSDDFQQNFAENQAPSTPYGDYLLDGLIGSCVCCLLGGVLIIVIAASHG